MWEVKPGYSITPGYDPQARRVPLATNPPPHSLSQKRKSPVQPPGPPPAALRRPATSPYSVAPGYDPGDRMIPASKAPSIRGSAAGAPQPTPRRLRPLPPSQPPPRRGPMPPSQPPPRRQAQARVMASAHQPWQQPRGAPARPPEPQFQPVVEAPDPPLRLSIPQDAIFLEGGLSTEGAAVYSDSRLQSLLSQVTHILSELLEDPSSEVVTEHDPDWEVFPEIGDALVAAGGAEGPTCVALCHSVGLWGVGVLGKWQKRETAARLALAVALVENHENADAIFEAYPEFAEFCQVQRPAKKKRLAVNKAKAAQPPRRKPTPPAHPPAHAPVAMQSDGLPRDMPLWIQLPVDELMPEQLDGFMPEALAVATEKNERRALYADIDKVLADLVEDPGSEIQYHDDADWKMFPTIGQALKELDEKEECLCVAVCPSRTTWAVGVGMKGKPRWQAAKVAIAATILWQARDAGEALPEGLDGHGMLDFVEEVAQARDAIGW